VNLGIGSFAYAWAIGVPGYPPARPMTAVDLVRRAADLGVRLVQFGDNLPLGALDEGGLAALGAEADALGVAIEVGTRGIERGHVARYLELAARFGSPILRVVIDRPDHHPEPDEVVATLAALMPEFERARVVLAIENHDRFAAATLGDIVAAIDSPWVGICLDTINSLGALEGPKEVTAVLAPHVVSLHVKDVAIRRSNETMGFVVEGRPAGAGMIDIPWLLAEIRSRARQPNVILELWPPLRPELAESIAIEDAWVVSSIRYLRSVVERVPA
jgi:3-oxoisoapionate decarboxylase